MQYFIKPFICNDKITNIFFSQQNKMLKAIIRLKELHTNLEEYINVKNQIMYIWNNDPKLLYKLSNIIDINFMTSQNKNFFHFYHFFQKKIELEFFNVSFYIRKNKFNFLYRKFYQIMTHYIDKKYIKDIEIFQVTKPQSWVTNGIKNINFLIKRLLDIKWQQYLLTFLYTFEYETLLD